MDQKDEVQKSSALGETSSKRRLCGPSGPSSPVPAKSRKKKTRGGKNPHKWSRTLRTHAWRHATNPQERLQYLSELRNKLQWLRTVWSSAFVQLHFDEDNGKILESPKALRLEEFMDNTMAAVGIRRFGGSRLCRLIIELRSPSDGKSASTGASRVRRA